MPRAAFVIAPTEFRDEEYAQPKSVLEARGVSVTTVSARRGPCRGKLGMLAHAETSLADLRVEEFDAVAFIGGGGSTVFFDDALAHALAKDALSSGKVLGAICIAPSILARAGVLDDRHATAFPSQETDLTAHGAIWTGAPVEIDGTVITANGPAAAIAFGHALADALRV